MLAHFSGDVTKNQRHRELGQYQDRLIAESQRDEFKSRVLSAEELIEATWVLSKPPTILDIASVFEIFRLSVKVCQSRDLSLC